jgi:hypothetical protein
VDPAWHTPLAGRGQNEENPSMLRASNLHLGWSGLAALVGGMLHALGDVLNLTHLGAPFAESIGSSLFFV